MGKEQVGDVMKVVHRKISIALTGRKLSDSHRRNMIGNRNALGSKRSDEARKAISMRMRGKKNGLGHKLTPEQIAKSHNPEIHRKISLAMMGKKNALGRVGNPTGFNGRGLSGYYFSPRLQCEVYYMSLFESRAFQILDIDDQVEYYIPQPLQIEYGDGRKYTPDILVFMIDGTMRLIEVKAEWELKIGSRNYGRNKLKFEAARKYCNSNNMTFEVWTESELWTSVNPIGGAN